MNKKFTMGIVVFVILALVLAYIEFTGLSVSDNQDNEKINITVKVLYEKTSTDGPLVFSSGIIDLEIPIRIDPNKNVSELKKLVYFKTNVNQSQQKLHYSGKLLEDDKTLASYGITDGKNVHLLLI